MALGNPTTDKSFSLAYGEAANEELNLNNGESVLVWFSTIPAGSGGQNAEECVIKFYVTDPGEQEILEPLGVAGRVWLWPLSFLAQQDGVFTMHFENSMGSSINKTFSLSYRVTQSAFGIPVEHLLLYMSIAVGVLVLIVVATMFLKTKQASAGSS